MVKLSRFLRKRKSSSEKCKIQEREIPEKEGVGSDQVTIDSGANTEATSAKAESSSALPKMSTSTTETDAQVQTIIRVSGLGNKFNVSLPSSTSTISDLQSKIEFETGLPGPYQRLISRGKTIYPEKDTGNQNPDDTNSTAHTNNTTESGETSLIKSGFMPGSTSKAILMHTQTYASDKQSIDLIQAMDRELEETVCSKSPTLQQYYKASSLSRTQESTNGGTITDLVARELITNICCRLDAVDTHGSKELRKLRKRVFLKADELDKLLISNQDTKDDGNGDGNDEEEKRNCPREEERN